MGGTKPSKMQRKLDYSPATSIFKQVPHTMAFYIQKHLHLLYQILEELWVKINVHVDDQFGFIHILPTRKSKVIEDWNKICENKLNKFLKTLDCQSVSLQPELLPEVQEIIKELKSDASLDIKERTVFQVTGQTQEVKKTLENTFSKNRKNHVFYHFSDKNA